MGVQVTHQGYTLVFVTGDDAMQVAEDLANSDDRFFFWRDPYYAHPDIYREIMTDQADPVREILAMRLASLMQTLAILDDQVTQNKILPRIYIIPAGCFNEEFKALPIVDQGNFARALQPVKARYKTAFVWEMPQALDPSEDAVYRTKDTPIEVVRTQLLMILGIGVIDKSILLSTIRKKAIDRGFKLVRQPNGKMDLPAEVYATFKAIAESKGAQVVDDINPPQPVREDRSGSPWYTPGFSPEGYQDKEEKNNIDQSNSEGC